LKQAILIGIDVLKHRHRHRNEQNRSLWQDVDQAIAC